MFKKVYFYNAPVIEICIKSNKSNLLTFNNNKDLTQFTNDVLSQANFTEIKIVENKNKIVSYERIIISKKEK